MKNFLPRGKSFWTMELWWGLHCDHCSWLTQFQILKTFRTKYRIEKFVRNTESVYITNNNTLEMILDNEKSVQKIRKNLSIIRKMEAYFLTVSENKDNRVKEFFRGIVNMVPTLPLNQNERADIDHVIRNIEEDSKFENKYKCELIMRHLLATISNWDKETHGTNSNLGSSIWKSIPSEMHTASQNSYVSEVIESSSFELANLSTDDSNLADLEGELRSASIRRAVEGPKGIYEFGYCNMKQFRENVSIYFQTLGHCFHFLSIF